MSSEFPLTFLLQVKNEMGTGISQATSQLKGMGAEAERSASKVKSSGIGIGAGLSLITMNLVNTANSIIGLKRQWEDLSRAQNNVTQSGFSLATAQNKLKTLEDKLAAARRGPGKASADELRLAEMRLDDAKHPGKGKTPSDTSVLAATIALRKERDKGKPDLSKIATLERNVENAKRRVTSAIINQKEAQQNLQRATQDFYLSTIPTAIGIAGSFATIIATLKGSGGIGGLTTSFLKFSPVLIGIGALFAALSTNFLGITTFFQNLGRDIGNAVPALKPFLSLIEAIFAEIGIGPKKGGLNKAAKAFMDSWKPIIDTFKNLVDNIMKGNWAGAFNVIKTAAVNAWNGLKQQAPFFAGVEIFINKIQQGKWKEAFDVIAKGAVDAWETLKEKVPFFAGVDIFIQKIKEGNWAEAWAVVAKGATEALGAIFGPDTVQKWVQQLQQIPAKIIAIMNMPGQTPGQKVVNILDAIIPTDIKRFGAQMAAWAVWFITELANQIKIGLTGLAHLYIDPFLASLFDLKTWQTAFTAFGSAFIQIARYFITGLVDVFKKPEESGKAANAIITGMIEWFKTNFPQTTRAVTAFINNIRKAILELKEQFIALGGTIWNMILQGLTPKLHPQSLLGRYQSGQGFKATGFHGIVTGPTPMLVGEHGPERVDVSRMGGGGPQTAFHGRSDIPPSGGSMGGSATIILNNYMDSELIGQKIIKNIGSYR